MQDGFSARGGKKKELTQLPRLGAPTDETFDPPNPRGDGPDVWARHMPHLEGISAAARTARAELETNLTGLVNVDSFKDAEDELLGALQRVVVPVALDARHPFHAGKTPGNGTGLNPVMGILFKSPDTEFVTRAIGDVADGNSMVQFESEVLDGGAVEIGQNFTGIFSDDAYERYFDVRSPKTTSPMEYALINAFRKGVRAVLTGKNIPQDQTTRTLLNNNVSFSVPRGESPTNMLLLPFAMGVPTDGALDNGQEFLKLFGRLYINSIGVDRNGKEQYGLVNRAIDGGSLKASISVDQSSGVVLDDERVDLTAPRASEVIAAILKAGGFGKPTLGQVETVVRLAGYSTLQAATQGQVKGDLFPLLAGMTGETVRQDAGSYIKACVSSVGQKWSANSESMLRWLQNMQGAIAKMLGPEGYAGALAATPNASYSSNSEFQIEPVYHDKAARALKNMNVLNGRGTGSKTSTTGLFVPHEKRHVTKQKGEHVAYGSKPSQKTFYNRDMKDQSMQEVVKANSKASGLSEDQVKTVFEEAGVEQIMRRAGDLFAISLNLADGLVTDRQGQLRPTRSQQKAYGQSKNKNNISAVLDGIQRVHQYVKDMSFRPQREKSLLKQVQDIYDYFAALFERPAMLGGAAAGAGGSG